MDSVSPEEGEPTPDSPPQSAVEPGIQAALSHSSMPSSRRRHSRRPARPLSQHINKPLRTHKWTSKGQCWTRHRLNRERAEFFDTCVTGRQEMWQALHAALEVLWTAEQGTRQSNDERSSSATHNDERKAALLTAQGILDAADISVPTGNLAHGAYDSLGNFYSLPDHIVSDPQNLCLFESESDSSDNIIALRDTDEECDGLVPRDRKEEKGKAVVDVRNLILVRARLSEGAQDVTLRISKDDPIRVLSKRVAEEAGLPKSKKIRIAYMGKILKDNSSLPSQDWKPGHMVNALVFNR